MTENTIGSEMAIGRRHKPAVAWPTLFLLVSVYSGLCVSIWLAVNGQVTIWISALLNTVILYGTYTVVHEGVHYNIVQKNGLFYWVNMAAAFVAAIPLWLLIYPHQRSHTLHHTRCNTEKDPDIYARGSFGVVALWRIPLAILSQINPVKQYRLIRDLELTFRQCLFSMTTYAGYVTIVLWIVAAGYAYELLVLWLIPFFIGYAIMLIFFTWVPHYPHTQVGRYRDTRCSQWRGGNFLTQGQNYHLIHHMMPWVPWFRYQQVFREIQPMLEQNNAIIDGFIPRPISQ